MSRCQLCGHPSHGPYCHAHTWAAGPGYTPNERSQTPATEHQQEPDLPIAVTDLHTYWMERYTPTQVIELAACLEAS